MEHELSTPFVQVTDAEMVFGQIPNMETAIECCPKEFFTSSMRGYHLLASDLFAHLAGWRSMTESQLAEMRDVTDTAKYTDHKWRYIQTWASSFAPKHQDKEAVMAWCLSLILKEPPPYTLK